jgi:hypothetical protein
MQVLVGWSEDMRTLGRFRFNCGSSIKVYPKQMERRAWNGLIWLKVGCHWSSLVKTIKNLRVPKIWGIFFIS